MNIAEKKTLKIFKALSLKRVLLYKMILFGLRASGDAMPYSDMDIVVILNKAPDKYDLDYISDCAWEAGFENGIAVVVVVFSREEWEDSPERYSLLAQDVEAEGVLI